MADITMCSGANCPKKDGCYRHTASANPYKQSYFMECPINKETKECEYFWSNEKENAKESK